jgi:hypothetical protein
VVDELQMDSITVSQRVWDRCLLPLLLPCPNRVSGVGANQDKFLLGPSPGGTSISAGTSELLQFFGKLTGMAVRHGLNLALDLSALIWRPLVGLPVSRAHLETVDTLAGTS